MYRAILCYLGQWKVSTPSKSICNNSIFFQNGKNSINTSEKSFKTNNSQLFKNVIHINECFYVKFLFKKAKYQLIFETISAKRVTQLQNKKISTFLRWIKKIMYLQSASNIRTFWKNFTYAIYLQTSKNWIGNRQWREIGDQNILKLKYLIKLKNDFKGLFTRYCGFLKRF